MVRRVMVLMGPPIQGTSEIARLNSRTMAELKVKEGRWVDIFQKGEGGTFKAARALPEDEDKNIVRVGEEDFKRWNYKLDEETTLSS